LRLEQIDHLIGFFDEPLQSNSRRFFSKASMQMPFFQRLSCFFLVVFSGCFLGELFKVMEPYSILFF